MIGLGLGIGVGYRRRNLFTRTTYSMNHKLGNYTDEVGKFHYFKELWKKYEIAQ